MQATQLKHATRPASSRLPQTTRRALAPPRRALGFPSMFTQGDSGSSLRGEDKARDVTANMLQGIIKMAVQSRLHHHEGVQVNVESNAMDILSGKFGGLTVSGQRWRTPLQLTAERLEVALGEMVLNYRALVLEQRISLRNVPCGTCTITLTAADLGNFVVHDLLKEPTSTAVEDQAFVFDRDSVRFRVCPRTKEASVYMEGDWAGDDSRYLVKMTPSSGVSRKAGALRMVAHRVGSSASSSPASSVSSSASNSDSESEGTISSMDTAASAEPVVACLTSTEGDLKSRAPTPEAKLAAAAAAILEKSRNLGSEEGSAERSLVSEAALNHRRNGGSTSSSDGSPPPVCNAARVEKGLASFFTQLSINLQGIELSKPSLSLLVPGEAEDSSTDSGSAIPPEHPLLTITMGLRLLNVPPLDMQF